MFCVPPSLSVPGRTEVLQCNARLHKMSLRLYDSKHDWAYAIFKPMIKGQIKKVRSTGRTLTTPEPILDSSISDPAPVLCADFPLFSLPLVPLSL